MVNWRRSSIISLTWLRPLPSTEGRDLETLRNKRDRVSDTSRYVATLYSVLPCVFWLLPLEEIILFPLGEH